MTDCSRRCCTWFYWILSLIWRRSDCEKKLFTILCCIWSLIVRIRRKFWLENEMVNTPPLEISEYRLNQFIFRFLFQLYIWWNYILGFSILHLDNLQHWIFTPKFSTRMYGVNDKYKITSKTAMNNPNSLPLFQRTNHYLLSITNILKLKLLKI